MTASAPLVSVLMPVYNGAKYLRQAMDSVLAQNFSDFEFIVVDDGSTDGSADIVRGCADRRVRLVQNERNIGLAGARNRALDEARGVYVAWLDADDRSAPSRLSRQVRYMAQHGNVLICGTWVRTFGDKQGDLWTYPVDPAVIRSRMLFDDPLATSSVMLRRDAFVKNGLRFDEQYPPAEDYDLWERASRLGEVANIDEPLTYYRVHGAHTSARMRGNAVDRIWEIQERQLIAMGIQPGAAERELHTKIGVNWTLEGSLAFIRSVKSWLTRLYVANQGAGIYPDEGFEKVLRERWYRVCWAGVRSGILRPREYWDVPFRSKGSGRLGDTLKLCKGRLGSLISKRSGSSDEACSRNR